MKDIYTESSKECQALELGEVSPWLREDGRQSRGLIAKTKGGGTNEKPTIYMFSLLKDRALNL